MRIRDTIQNVNFYDFLNSHETYENQSKALIKEVLWRYIWRYKFIIKIKLTTKSVFNIKNVADFLSATWVFINFLDIPFISDNPSF